MRKQWQITLGAMALLTMVVAAEPELFKIGERIVYPSLPTDPVIKWDIVEDREHRPTKIQSYYLDEQGRKVLHGVSIEYNWGLGTREVETFNRGGARGLEIKQLWCMSCPPLGEK